MLVPFSCVPLIHTTSACPGRQLAEASLFTYLAMILATFNISKARDEKRNEIQPEVKFVSNLITCAQVPFIPVLLLCGRNVIIDLDRVL